MIELVKPEFQAGSEKRFFDFISNLDETDKIAIISHTDVDGISAAKIINEVIKADKIVFVNYSEFNVQLFKSLKDYNINKIIISDLGMDNEELIKYEEKEFEILYIDHHEFPYDFNSEKITLMNTKGYCAAYLAYYLFSRVQNLEKYDWLVVCASMADIAFDKNESWISKVYEKYGEEFRSKGKNIDEISTIVKYMRIIDNSLVYFKEEPKKVFDLISENPKDLNELKKYADIIGEYERECEEKFRGEREVINERYFWSYTPKYKVGSQISTSLSLKEPERTIIIGRREGDMFYISARRNDFKENMNLLLKRLVSGFENSSAGGHIPAAGGAFPVKHLEEFKKRLRELPENLDL